MSASTKQAAIAAFFAHFEDEAKEILGIVTNFADAAAPIVATGLAAAGQEPAAAATVAVAKTLDAAEAVAKAPTATGIAGLVQTVEAAVKSL